MSRSLIFLAALSCISYAPAQTFLGPTPYLQFADSPWFGVTFDYFHLETVEDNLFNAPGATLATGIVTSSGFGLSSLVDSVDEDDGSVNGTNGFGGTFGDSLFSASTITISFSAGVLGSLPTHAGLVWTDGSGTITFEAFDSLGASLGTVTGNHADLSVAGTTAEDRFYGVIHGGGFRGSRSATPAVQSRPTTSSTGSCRSPAPLPPLASARQPCSGAADPANHAESAPPSELGGVRHTGTHGIGRPAASPPALRGGPGDPGTS